MKNQIKSKGKEIKYDYLRCQNYLLPNNNLTFDQQIKIFSFRIRMNSLKYNFKGKHIIELCLCNTEILVNQHLYECEILNEGRKNNTPYNKLFNGTLMEQYNIVNTLEFNMENYRKYSQTLDLSTSR